MFGNKTAEIFSSLRVCKSTVLFVDVHANFYKVNATDKNNCMKQKSLHNKKCGEKDVNSIRDCINGLWHADNEILYHTQTLHFVSASIPSNVCNVFIAITLYAIWYSLSQLCIYLELNPFKWFGVYGTDQNVHTLNTLTTHASYMCIFKFNPKFHLYSESLNTQRRSPLHAVIFFSLTDSRLNNFLTFWVFHFILFCYLLWYHVEFVLIISTLAAYKSNELAKVFCFNCYTEMGSHQIMGNGDTVSAAFIEKFQLPQRLRGSTESVW